MYASFWRCSGDAQLSWSHFFSTLSRCRDDVWSTKPKASFPFMGANRTESSLEPLHARVQKAMPSWRAVCNIRVVRKKYNIATRSAWIDGVWATPDIVCGEVKSTKSVVINSTILQKNKLTTSAKRPTLDKTLQWGCSERKCSKHCKFYRPQCKARYRKVFYEMTVILLALPMST